MSSPYTDEINQLCFELSGRAYYVAGESCWLTRISHGYNYLEEFLEKNLLTETGVTWDKLVSQTPPEDLLLPSSNYVVNNRKVEFFLSVTDFLKLRDALKFAHTAFTRVKTLKSPEFEKEYADLLRKHGLVGATLYVKQGHPDIMSCGQVAIHKFLTQAVKEFMEKVSGSEVIQVDTQIKKEKESDA